MHISPNARRLSALLLPLLVACTGDTNSSSDTSDIEDADVAEDTTADTSADSTDADVDEDVATDTVDDTADTDEADTGPGPQPECDPDEHSVGPYCRPHYDRACVYERDCRTLIGETCVFDAEGDRYGTCIYTPPAPVQCPGGADCLDADGVFRAGFAVVDITPRGWEVPRDEAMDGWRFGGNVNDPTTFCDCGRDMVCPPGDAYAGCPSFGDYDAPDADGSEGDGHMQGIWLAGFSASRPALPCPEAWAAPDCEGSDCCTSPLVHDPIEANVVVFDQGETRVAIVSLDVVGYLYHDVTRIRALMPEDAAVDRLIVASTHNHEGPDTYGQWGPSFQTSPVAAESGVDKVWMSDVVYTGVVDGVLEAIAALTPVDVHVGELHPAGEHLPMRDTRDPWVFNDRLVSVFFTNPGGSPAERDTLVGTLVNWHVHPEVLWSDQNQLTSDFPHYVRRYVTEGLDETEREGEPVAAIEGTGVPTVYLSGTVGGLLNPGADRAVTDRSGVTHNGPTYGRSDAYGQHLAAYVLQSRTDTEPITPSLYFTEDEILVRVENSVFRTAGFMLGLLDRDVYNWRESDGTSDRLPMMRTAVTQVRLGDLTLQTTPGEPFSEMFTGYTPASMWEGTVVGDPGRLDCAANGLPPVGDEPVGFPCVVDPGNPLPPDLDAAPQDGGFYHRLPGNHHVVIGLGNDALGYLVPSYDYVLGSPASVNDAPGDHYEEKNSVGNFTDMLFEVIDGQIAR